MATTLYQNGEILTMVGDSKDTVKYVESVVEKDSLIVFAGPVAKARQIFPNATIIDLNGKCMMPGHIDPHLHPSLGSMILSMHFITPFDWTLPSGFYEGVRDEEGYRSRLKSLIHDKFAEYSKTPTQWLITWGYHGDFHGEMSREIIDKLVQGKSDQFPIVVWHRSFHEIYLNSVARDSLQFKDINDRDAVMQNPQVDWEKGNFYEVGLDVLTSIAINFSSQQLLPLIAKGYPELVKVINQSGITAIADMEFPLLEENMEGKLANKYLHSSDAYFSTYGCASSRNYGKMANGNHKEAIKLIHEASDRLSNDQFILFKDHVKCFIDGAFYSQKMQMLDGYLDKHDGKWMTPPKELAAIMKVYWKNGFQIHVHTTGDLGMEILLDIVEDLTAKYPREDHKTTIEHAGYFNENQAKRIAELGMLVSAAPYYFHTLADAYSAKGLGPERAHRISPVKMLFEREVTTAFHSDFMMAPSQPLLLAWTAINRITADGNEFPEGNKLKISPYEGMLAVTKNAARILGTDDIMGTIEEGKLANFTILDKNPLKVDPKLIKDIKIEGSVYKGRINNINLS